MVIDEKEDKIEITLYLLVCSMMADASEAKKYSTFSPGLQREISSPWGPDEVIRNSAEVLRGVAVPEADPCECFFLFESTLKQRA